MCLFTLRISGNWPWEIEKLHKKYGDIVRIGPNELSFSHPQSIKDIYSQANINHPDFFTKFVTFYKQSDVGGSIGTEVDPYIHQRVRKVLAPGFSSSALRRQGDIVVHHIDALLEKIEEAGGVQEGMDMSKWFMWLAFDIIVDLAFGEELGTVEQGMCFEELLLIVKLRTSFTDITSVIGQGNDWINMLANSGFQIALGYVVRRRWQPIQEFVRYCLVNGKSRQMREDYIRNAREKASQRLARGAEVERFDFFTHLVSGKAQDATLEFLSAQGTTLVAAGTETTSTFMAALTHYLLRHPKSLKRLQKELRTQFKSHKEVDGESTKSLKYLNAVVEEGMRVFAPAPFGLPRKSPGAYITGEWIPKDVRYMMRSIRGLHKGTG